MKGKGSKYITLLSLYAAQAIPMSFFSTVLPVIMRREGFPLDVIGMLQLIKLPWIFKFIWAPTVDAAIQNVKANKRLILMSEIFYAVVICAVAFLHLDTDFTLIIILMVIAIAFSATQDIATDAMAARILKSGELSVGNGIQSAGSFIGALFGSGVLLVAYSYWGWQNIMFLLAGVVLLALIPMLLQKNITFKPSKAKPISHKDIFLFFKGQKLYILFLFFVYSGIIGLLSMMKPYMVDQGFSNIQIGFISGILGPATAIICSIAAGIIMKRISYTKALQFFVLLQIISVLSFFLYEIYSHEWILFIAVVLVWCSYSSTSVAVYSIAMRKVREKREGTDFSVQIIITHLSGIIMAIVGGKIARHFGFNSLFALELILASIMLFSLSFNKVKKLLTN